MGRKPAVEFRGGVYHIVQRGNNREYIFRKKEDKVMLLEVFLKYRDVYGYKILGYAIMDNHYHVIMKTDQVYISSVMHRINTEFAKTYNRIKKRTGHVYEKRYKGILVKDDSYLLSLLRYVHQNPVKARMCRTVSDYRWTSDSSYRRNKGDGLVSIDLILDMFAADRRRALAEYARFMDEDDFESSEMFEDTAVIGDIKPLKVEKTLQENSRESMDELLKLVTASEKDFTKIKSASRSRRLTPLKIRYIEECLKRNYRMEEIGKNIGISQAAVSKLLN
ncbi:REP element-mobilizing transposase RayT [Dethiosulfatibacter aminovorans DSM 17477]|uniref:REP element-mobilizing transposase RayT n=1 Tax=Dethiosulfatibacter aminovorans DSM 17477 TaxID=1121476 RepID=A0A1M6MRY9_9FIRM|nr:transposase [Dethiosulfatibacter aminovorans]SHJ86231.1 REP element-mobilizing transposase RayT [Dethiosulfatibacter aminovorans DSM 17477]